MTVHLYPVEGVSLYPYPAAEIDLPDEEAAVVLGFSPPPFTTKPPATTTEPRLEVSETPTFAPFVPPTPPDAVPEPASVAETTEEVS